MILTIDVGNTNIKLAAYKDGEIQFWSRLKTEAERTDDEYMLMLHNLLDMYGIARGEIEGCILSSVVPSLVEALRGAVAKAIGCRLLVVGSGLKTGLNIKIDNPGTLGGDFVAAAVGTIKKYPLPAVIVSLGSATTFSVVDQNGAFLGGAILPGIDVSLKALTQNTAQLPGIGLDPPRHAIGTNTVDCMNVGVIYGNAGMIDAMYGRFAEELGEIPTIVATGGRASFIVPYCRENVLLDETLVLDGLLEIYRKNTRG